MSARLGSTVVCSECGKRLRGHVGVTAGFHVRKHKTPAGKSCWGVHRTDHRLVGGAS